MQSSQLLIGLLARRVRALHVARILVDDYELPSELPDCEWHISYPFLRSALLARM